MGPLGVTVRGPLARSGEEVPRSVPRRLAYLLARRAFGRWCPSKSDFRPRGTALGQDSRKASSRSPYATAFRSEPVAVSPARLKPSARISNAAMLYRIHSGGSAGVVLASVCPA